MSIAITWATSAGGSDINDLDTGNSSAGSNTTEQALYISHNGNNAIQNAKLFIAAKATGYAGAATAEDDYNELLFWGDSTDANVFGGLQLNLDSDGGFPASAYGTVSSKDPTGGKTIRTGVGDTVNNGIILPTTTGIAVAGTIQPTEEAALELRFLVPVSEGTTGKREVDLKLRYQYTS